MERKHETIFYKLAEINLPIYYFYLFLMNDVNDVFLMQIVNFTVNKFRNRKINCAKSFQ